MKTWLILEIPSTEISFKWLGFAFIFYLGLCLSLSFFIRWVEIRINHPLAQFLSIDCKEQVQVKIELERYNQWLKFILAHGLSTTIVWLGLFLSYQSNYLLYIDKNSFRLYYALRKSFHLQADKYEYLIGKVSDQFSNDQFEMITYTNDLLRETLKLFTATYAQQMVEAQTEYYKLIFTIILLLILMIVCLILARKFFTQSFLPHALIIPSSQGLPGWLILKLVYPLLFLTLISLVLYYWKRSRLSFADYVSQQILADSSKPMMVANQLKVYRYYIVGTIFGGNIILVVNWLIFAVNFVSYRFSSLGTENLIKFQSDLEDVKQILIDRNEKEELVQEVDKLNNFYTLLIDNLEVLEQTLTPMYDQQIDPVRRFMVVAVNSFIS